MMTQDEALSHMISRPAKPWADAEAWYAARVADFELFRRRVANYRLPPGFTTHDIAVKAGFVTPAARADELARIGEALFGPSWQTPLAAELGVAVRTVQRWASGERSPSEGVWRDLAALCRSRAKALDGIARGL
jgi:hypothetical protein